MNRNIIIIAEQSDGKILPVTHELIAAANKLQQLTDLCIKIVMTGSKISDDCRHLSEKYGIDMILINSGSSAVADETALKTLPASLFDDLNPAYVIMAHTARGLDAAPGIAVKINAACITGIEKISRQDGSVCLTRSIFNDRITDRIQSCVPTTVMTILPGIFKPETGFKGQAGKISIRDLPFSSDDYQMIEFKSDASDTSALDNADVIVSAGNGIKEKENLDLVFQLAELFPKSAVSGSRPICDKKWLKYALQVGITGATVTPKLYIACGISGSSQHISGMRDSKFIVSINTDPHAAIFNISDVCIIEDLTTFIPQFITAYHKSQSKG